MAEKTNKKENKKNKKRKSGNIIAIISCLLAAILLSMIAIFGIYAKNGNRMVNQLKEISYGMDIKGARTVVLTPSTETNTIVKDAEGNEVEDGSSLTDDEITQNGYTKEEIPVNSSDVLNKENYIKSKEIIQARFKDLGIENYNISVNEENGEITLEIPEDDKTDNLVSNLVTKGKFQIIDSETEEVLMDNNDIKDVQLIDESSYGSGVYLNIKFNKEGTTKFENITSIYTNSTNSTNTADTNTTNTTDTNATENTTNTADTNSTDSSTTEDTSSEDTSKTVTMKIDDDEIMTTEFDEVIKNGEMSLSVGSSTTDKDELATYVENAKNIEATLDNEEMPIKYEGTKNEYILSDIAREQLNYVKIGIIIVIAIALLVLIIRYKLYGFLASIAYVAFAAIYTILLRYANVTISLEGIFGIAIVFILNYIFVNKLLHRIREEKEEYNLSKITKETYKEYFIKIIPLCIMAITFCFIKWTPISSFGMVMFWGILLIAIYNVLVTVNMMKLKAEKRRDSNEEKNK